MAYRMQLLLSLSVLLAVVSAGPISLSLSPAVGPGIGCLYSIRGIGRITAVKIWEMNNGYIHGIQLRYGRAWSLIAGFTLGTVHEMELFDGEFIVQISGKYIHFIRNLMFVTNRGRSIMAGQPGGQSFNMYASRPAGELRFLSRHFQGGLTSIAAHWAVLNTPSN